MLYLYLGRKKGYRHSGDITFDHGFDRSNIQKPFAKKVIKEIDKSEVLGKDSIISPIIGSRASTFLSGGSKTLICLMYGEGIGFYLEAMGDNCLSLLKEVADSKDIHMCTTTMRDLFSYGFTKFVVENTNEIVTDRKRWLDLQLDYLLESDIDEG